MCKCSQCGWPVHGGYAITLPCPRCGNLIECDGEAIESSTEVSVAPDCVHMGDAFGKMECECGVAYHCKLLGKLCSRSKPIDEWVVAISYIEPKTLVQLDDKHFQCCATCEHNSANSTNNVIPISS